MKNAILLSCAVLAACAKTSDKPADTAAPGSAEPAQTAMQMGETLGMKTPESVKYDADMDVYFVSNINGNPSEKDGNGFIVAVRADSNSISRVLVQSGKASGGGKPIRLDAAIRLAAR